MSITPAAYATARLILNGERLQSFENRAVCSLFRRYLTFKAIEIHEARGISFIISAEQIASRYAMRAFRSDIIDGSPSSCTITRRCLSASAALSAAALAVSRAD